ncbi:MAG TPA: hypothetical protein VE398_20975 [Acidobacteriota bacterium]|nr:hypothetical protein [Acidobacteriota bacterium]
MKGQTLLLRCTILFGIAGFLMIPSIQAQTCRDSDYHGVFSALVVGEFIQPPPGLPPGPNARLGRVEADGHGNASIHAILSLDGFIFPEDYQGIYSVNPDCTMDVTLFVRFPGFPQPFPLQWSGMLVDQFREVSLLLVNPPGTTFGISLQKQPKNMCTNNDLKGSYGLAMRGSSIFAPGIPPGPAARVGKVTFDGSGSFTSSINASYDGTITQEEASGTYSVDSNCLFTMSYVLRDSNGTDQSYQLTGMLKDNSRGADLIQNEPQGMVITGTLTKK